MRSDTPHAHPALARPSSAGSSPQELWGAALPRPLLTSEVGSFARQTVAVRQPQIIDRLVNENGYPTGIVSDLLRLSEEIATSPMELLSEDAPDVGAWNDLIASQPERAWLDTSWYFAESCFYRRVLEAVRYFQDWARRGEDPFGAQKLQQAIRATTDYRALPATVAGPDPESAFVSLLHSCLWGNRADLSNLAMQAAPLSGLASQQDRYRIIVDHTERAFALLASGVEQVDFVCDNVGLDVLADLALADFLLAKNWVDRIRLHLKDRPFFVSDAMAADVATLLNLMARSENEGLKPMAGRLTAHLQSGQLILTQDAFWASGLMFRQLPGHISATLERSDLVILKGDVNYRRLLDDRHWPFTTRMSTCAGYFPAKFLALRTLKGEIVAGLEPGQAQACAREDPSWLTNGMRGIVQMGGPSK